MTPKTIPNAPGNLPMAPEVKHPLRTSIRGDTDTVENLKKIIAAKDMDDTLKSFIAEELAEIKTNAASVDLHLLDNPDGSVVLHLHIKPVKLGARS